MKRLLCALLCLGLIVSLCACGQSASGSTEPKDYPAILTDARTAEENETHVVFYYKDGTYTATGGYSADLTADDIAKQGLLCLQILGLDPADLAEAAFTVSLMNVDSYAMVIAKPASGKTDSVKTSLVTFIEGQKAAQQNYLPDQYAIASAARLETQKTGEVVLVMRETQDTAYEALQKALK